MKIRRLLPVLLSASLFSGLGVALAPHALAQPDAPVAAKAGKKGRAKGVKAVRGGLPKRMATKIEEQMGKPLTEDQRARLNTAYKARADARKTADAKYASEVEMVTGLTTEQVASLNKRGPAAGAKKAAAPR